MDARLLSVFTAGSRMFIEHGFKNTQVSDIAKAAGIATGSMYKLFDSKLACLHFCLRTACMGGQIEECELPLHEMHEGELMRVMLDWAERYMAIYDGISERMSFAEMLPCVYDCMVKYRDAILLVETCTEALGEAGAEYWRQRQQLFALLEVELKRYMDRGEMRRIPYLHHLVPSFVSMMADWALHSFYGAHSEKIDESTARTIALDLTYHAYRAREDE